MTIATITGQNRKMRVDNNGAENGTAAEDPRPSPPPLLPLIRENIPFELFDYGQWVTWDLQWRAGKNGGPGGWTKPPLNPHTGGNADSSKPSTWAPAAYVLKHCERLGFVLTEADPFTFLDIDDGVDPATGRLKRWARAIVDRFPGYWEFSPTKTGLKGLIRARAPRNRMIPLGDGKVEIFSTGKYTTLTGHILPGSGWTIADRQVELDAFLAELDATAEVKPPRPATPPPALDITDEAIIERVIRMPRGRQLHATGDPSGYASGSEADLALCNAYVAGGATDGAQVDRLYRSSALGADREKWDRADYRERTIAKALDGTVRLLPDREPFRTAPSPPTVAPFLDEAVSLPNDPAALKILVLEERHARRAAEHERDDLRATLARREEQRQLDQRTREAPNVQPEKDLIVALGWTYEVASQGDPTIPRGDGRFVERRTADGFVRVRRGDLAALTGKSLRTITTQLATIKRLGLVDVRHEPERFIDPETGEVEIDPASTVIYLRPPNGDVRSMHQRAITATAEDRKLATGKAATWGGPRKQRCPDHPDALRISRTVVSCAECGYVIESRPGASQDDHPPALAATGTAGATPLEMVSTKSTSMPRSSLAPRGPRLTPGHLDQGGRVSRFVARADLAERTRGTPLVASGPRPHRRGCVDCGGSVVPGMSYCPEHGGQMNEGTTVEGSCDLLDRTTAPPASAGEPAPAADSATDQESRQRATDDLAASLGPIAADRWTL